MSDTFIPFSAPERFIPEPDRILVFRFFLCFSRFEYALKASHFIRGGENGAQPDWAKFAEEIATAFDLNSSEELKQAVEYFVKEPPQKQIASGKRLSWKPPESPTKVFLPWLLLRVRGVRNNLFHGGKYPIAPIDEPVRNVALLKHSLTILAACLDLNNAVKTNFANYEG